MQTKKTAFIFDMDGVILDSEPIHSIAKCAAFSHFDIPFDPARLPQFMGRTSDELFSIILRETDREDVSVEELALYKRKVFIEFLETPEKIQPIAGTIALIEKLQKKEIPLALATGSHRTVMQLVLKNFHLENTFCAALSGSDFKESKPNPEIYLTAAKALCTAPSDCVVLEDTASGIHAAKAAGMYCIAFDNPNTQNQDLSAADEIVKNIHEIPLDQLFPEK